MNDLDLNKKLLNLMESYPMMGMPQEDQESENVTYSKTKRQGDASVTISANAKSMEELHDVLRLAGITLPKSDKAEEPNDPMDKDSDDVCDCCDQPIDSDGDCGCDDHEHPKQDGPSILKMPAYSTDKSVIINALKDKLAQKLS